MACTTWSAISLNERASRWSSGGPPPGATRAAIRPVAMSWVALSRVRTGRSTHSVSRTASSTATAIAAASPPASTSHLCSTRARSAPVGDSLSTTATTSPSRTTGAATVIVRSSVHGQTCGGLWLRRPSSASWKAWAPQPTAGTRQSRGATAIGAPSRWKMPRRTPYRSK